MKLKTIAILIALISTLLLFCRPIFAADGNELLRRCETTINNLNNLNSQKITGDPYDVGFCIGYIQGVQQLNTFYRFSGADPVFCGPDEGVPNEQNIRILTKYLRDHPEKLHEHDIFLVIEALREAFPCGK